MSLLASRPRRTSLRAILLASSLVAVSIGGLATAPAWAGTASGGYADLVAKVSPEVVFIEVTILHPDNVSGSAGGPGSPFDQFLKRFGQANPGFRMPDAPKDTGPLHALGSGFVISSDGEIVTNNHVVDGASVIKVKLQDGREYSAHVIGTDPLTDVALIKLDKAKDLPVASFAATGSLRVGDAVVAIGNPFGLGGTVTSGIVSAMGRNIESGPYDNFIQTDAAINKGNSGGPLFNTDGQVVGMNTAIFSPTGGSVGIGFSVPADTIQSIVTQLRDHGAVARGWLGVSIQPITNDLAQALGMSKTEGAMVAQVLPDGPAAKSDLKSGDVILSVNGAPVDEKHGLPTIVASLTSGTKVELAILRDGKPEKVSVTIGTLAPEKLQNASATPAEKGNKSIPLGITVEALKPDIAAQLGLSDTEKGVVISAVSPDSLNSDRLRPGDVIVQAANKPVTSPESLAAAVAGDAQNHVVLLKLTRDGKTLFVGAEMSKS